MLKGEPLDREFGKGARRLPLRLLFGGQPGSRGRAATVRAFLWSLAAKRGRISPFSKLARPPPPLARPRERSGEIRDRLAGDRRPRKHLFRGGIPGVGNSASRLVVEEETAAGRVENEERKIAATARMTTAARRAEGARGGHTMDYRRRGKASIPDGSPLTFARLPLGCACRQAGAGNDQGPGGGEPVSPQHIGNHLLACMTVRHGASV